MTVAVVLLNLAYLVLLGSTLTRGVSGLRLMLIGASAFFAAYGVVEGIKLMVAWNVGIAGMHLYQLGRDWQKQRSITLDDTQREIKDLIFSDVSDFDFLVMWQLGRPRTVQDEVLIRVGERPDTVAVIVDGVVEIRRDGELFRGLRRGALLGEMSFVSGAGAKVDVVARGTLVLHEWTHQSLLSLDQVHPAGAKAMDRLIARDLSSKAAL